MEIKNIETIEQLNKLFYFFSKLFYSEAMKENKRYNLMGERYDEMKD